MFSYTNRKGSLAILVISFLLRGAFGTVLLYIYLRPSLMLISKPRKETRVI